MNSRINYKTQAIVLRTLDYGESDRIVTFYTAEFGKVKGIAKGARRSTKRFANTLEPFSCLELIFSRRHPDGLALVEAGAVINYFPQIRRDLKKTLYASYMIDITDQFTLENKTNTELFRLVGDFLELLDLGSVSEDLVRFFEMRLLRLVGYEPVLDRCVACQAPVENGAMYHFSVRDGGLKCGTCSPRDYDFLGVSTGTVKSMLLGKDLEREKLCRLMLSEQGARESRHFLERFIAHLLGKEVKSLHVLREIRELGI
jgi:DNA repair protein RecO (recombination protein O)